MWGEIENRWSTISPKCLKIAVVSAAPSGAKLRGDMRTNPRSSNLINLHPSFADCGASLGSGLGSCERRVFCSRIQMTKQTNRRKHNIDGYAIADLIISEIRRRNSLAATVALLAHLEVPSQLAEQIHRVLCPASL